MRFAPMLVMLRTSRGCSTLSIGSESSCSCIPWLQRGERGAQFSVKSIHTRYKHSMFSTTNVFGGCWIHTSYCADGTVLRKEEMIIVMRTLLHGELRMGSKWDPN